MVCRSDAGGTLLLPNLPGDLYLEAEVVLPAREMEAHLILRAAEDLSAGYKLALHPAQEMADVRHTSGGDVNRVLVCGCDPKTWQLAHEAVLSAAWGQDTRLHPPVPQNGVAPLVCAGR